MPWVLIAVVASLMGVLVVIAARRSRRRTADMAEDLDDIDAVVASDMRPPDRAAVVPEDGGDAVIVPSS